MFLFGKKIGKKFGKKNKPLIQIKQDKSYEIICLYCFAKFPHNRVLFRALRALDEEGYRPARDRVLDDYREKFHKDSLGPLPVALDPSDFSESSKSYTRGVLTGLKDAYDNWTAKRICPHCRNDIPKSAGHAPGTVISFVGASQSGKSVFMTSLIHALKTSTPRNFNIFCAPINHEMSMKFKSEYEDPLIEHGRLLDPTQLEKQQEPFIFTFSFADDTKPEINIAFFDIAGEGMVDNAYLDIYAAHIRNSSGLMFMVDPMQFRALGRKIQLKNNLDFDHSSAEEPVDVLGGLVDNYIHRESGSVLQTPTAVVLTKTDLLEALRPDGEYISQSSHMFTNFIHKGYFDLSAAENIGGEVEEFMNQADPNFRNALKRRFGDLGFFGVSALGSQPDGGRVASFSPVRVEEPFLWLLYKLGYIDGRKV